jgi:spermidine synthase
MLDGVHVDVVEINPKVVDVAQRYFDFDPSKVRIHLGDGRTFIHQKDLTQKYDTIILDAFLGDSSPSHLLTREAFLDMRRILADDGTIVINAFGSLEKEQDFFDTSLHRTLKSVFNTVRVHHSGPRIGNMYFVASTSKNITVVNQPHFDEVPAAIHAKVKADWRNVASIDETKGMILTDDYNPIEFFDARVREDIRRLSAIFAKKS